MKKLDKLLIELGILQNMIERDLSNPSLASSEVLNLRRMIAEFFRKKIK